MSRLKQLQVLVSDSSSLSGQLIALALGQDPSLKAEQISPASVIEAAQLSRPEMAILSHTLDGVQGKGLEILNDLLAVSPKTRAIMLLDCEDSTIVVDCLRCGARGVFCRSHPLELLVRCVKVVHTGQVWISATEMEFLLTALVGSSGAPIVDARGMPLLSRREQDVIGRMVEGLTNREIAERLSLSENTVKNYVYKIFDKLGVSNRVEAVMYAAAHASARAKSPSPPAPEKSPRPAASPLWPVSAAVGNV